MTFLSQLMKRPKIRIEPDDPEQPRRFIDMTHELEADERPDAMDRALERVIGKPKSHPAPASRPKGR